MRPPAALALLGLLLAGCATTTGFSWSLPAGGSDAPMRADKYECAKAAVDPLKVSGYREHLYVLCMEAKGYRRSLW
jgi:hypothetical protein